MERGMIAGKNLEGLTCSNCGLEIKKGQEVWVTWGNAFAYIDEIVHNYNCTEDPHDPS